VVGCDCAHLSLQSLWWFGIWTAVKREEVVPPSATSRRAGGIRPLTVCGFAAGRDRPAVVSALEKDGYGPRDRSRPRASRDGHRDQFRTLARWCARAISRCVGRAGRRGVWGALRVGSR